MEGIQYEEHEWRIAMVPILLEKRLPWRRMAKWENKQQEVLKIKEEKFQERSQQ